MQRTISFSECEHHGDLEDYEQDLRKSGAKIISSEVNEDEETGYIEIELEQAKVAEFMEEFRITESYEFSSLG